MALTATAVMPQSYPSRPVRLIVPYPPGGGSDVIARILAPKVSEVFGQQVVIDNRGGAASIIGLDMLAKAPPNGYTFGIATITLAVNSTLNKSLPFDTLRDFAPIMHAVDGLYVLVVHPAVPAKSVAELVALAKSAPAKMNAAIAGAGTPMHLGLVQFNSLVGTTVAGITYKGAGPALQDLIGQQLPCLMTSFRKTCAQMHIENVQHHTTTQNYVGTQAAASFSMARRQVVIFADLYRKAAQGHVSIRSAIQPAVFSKTTAIAL